MHIWPLYWKAAAFWVCCSIKPSILFCRIWLTEDMPDGVVVNVRILQVNYHGFDSHFPMNEPIVLVKLGQDIGSGNQFFVTEASECCLSAKDECLKSFPSKKAYVLSQMRIGDLFLIYFFPPFVLSKPIFQNESLFFSISQHFRCKLCWLIACC